MLRLLCLILAVTYIQCPNHRELSVDQIASLVWTDMNRQGNLTVDVTDLDSEFIGPFDHNGDGSVGRNEFIHQWQLVYHDHQDTASDFFDRLDIHRDGILNSLDLLMHLHAHDTNHDGVLSKDEFLSFMRYVHPDSTHHGHGHHGHPDQALG